MGFSRREYWSGFHSLLQGPPNPRIEPGKFFTPELPGKPSNPIYSRENSNEIPERVPHTAQSGTTAEGLCGWK